MNYKDYEKFAKENSIATTEVEGEFGCGYACAYMYYVPESVINLFNAKAVDYAALLESHQDLLGSLKDMVRITRADDWHMTEEAVIEAAEKAIERAEGIG